MITIPSRTETITQFKKHGGRIAAVLPIHYPRELLRAFNFLPVEVWGPPKVESAQGARHLQAYVCSICHHALSFLTQGGLDIADLILVPHACDSLQGLGSLLLDFIKPRQGVLRFYIPREGQRTHLEFLAAELQSLYAQLVEFSDHEPGMDLLAVCIEREERADELLNRLHRQNQYLPLSNREIYQMIRSREYLPAEAFGRIAGEVLDQAQEQPRPGIPILIEGIVPEPMALFDTLSELNAAVVGDDLANCGRRLYPTGTAKDPFLRMAERILQAPPDPTRGSSLKERSDHLLALAHRTGAKGVLFYVVKFCEPEFFDVPILRQILRDTGLPSILIEVDLNTAISNQVRTRLGAFMEMLG